MLNSYYSFPCIIYTMQFLRDVTSNRLISTSVLILTNIYSICSEFYIVHVFVFFLSHIFNIILSILCLFLLKLYTLCLYRNASKQLRMYCHLWIPNKFHFGGGWVRRLYAFAGEMFESFNANVKKIEFCREV